VFSFNSFANYAFANRETGEVRRKPVLSETTFAAANEIAENWKQGRPSWKSLRALLAP
jgi:hypothetical protein